MDQADHILIAGPTGSGKSALALALAEALDGTIVNADSMQVYRELRVLTARPSEADEARVPHRLYGHFSARDAYSVGAWLADVAPALGAICQDGRRPIIVGGTGLYFNALLDGLSQVPDIPAHIRRHWRGEAERLGSEALYRLLAERDPQLAAELSPNDRQRIARGLEVLDATGRSLTTWQAKPSEGMVARDRCVRLLIAPDREVLYERCNARFDKMLEGGAIEEVRHLLEMDIDTARPAMRALGVPDLVRYLRGHCTLKEAGERSKMETRRYAKRQMTWFRKSMADWRWLSHDDAVRIAQRPTAYFGEG